MRSKSRVLLTLTAALTTGLAGLAMFHLGATAQEAAAIEGTRIARIANLTGINLGTAPTTLSYPAAIRVAGNGDNFILDCGNGRVAVTASTGAAKASFSLDTPAKTQWEAITDLALDKAGNVYLTNAVANSVEKYSAAGRKLATFATGQIKQPQGLAITSNGEIVVSDTMNHAIAIFDAEGKLLKKFGRQGDGNGQFQYPRGVAVDSQGNIYVADSLNARIQVFNSEGSFVRKWGSKGDKAGQFQMPAALAIDATNIWVSDPEFNRIQKFDLDGTKPQIFALPAGTQADALNHPKGIAVTATGTLIIANSGNHAVDVFRLANK
jgi:tripartite motif-containing protein 71